MTTNQHKATGLPGFFSKVSQTLLPGLLLGLSMGYGAPLWGQNLETQVLDIASSRLDEAAQPVKVPLVLEAIAGKPKAVLLVLPSQAQSLDVTLPSAQQVKRFEPLHHPMSRNRQALLESGLALAWMGWPAPANFGVSAGAHPDMQKDIARVIEHTRQRWPGTPIILSGTDGGGYTALAYVLERRASVQGLLVFSPYWLRQRQEPVEKLQGLKALVLYDTSGECLGSSALEVEEIAKRAKFTRLPVHASSAGDMGRCSSESAVWLKSADAQLPQVIDQWLQAQPLPDHLGAAEPVVTATERVIMAPGKSGQIEISVHTPPGLGPFPLLVFNHGDAEMSHPSVKYKARFRDPVITATFLKLGLAVAIPARPGVGRSDGRYSYSHYAVNDGDASYKARQHSEAVLSALNGLKQATDLKQDQVLLAGQSAGGDTVMYMSTLALPGFRGVINFSGGRSNHRQGETPTFENKMMIEGWADLGRVAKVPAMLVFAENDSRYSANTIRKSAQAYRDAGGQADLLLTSPLTGDGHFIHQNPTLWSSAVARFITGLKLDNQVLDKNLLVAPGIVPLATAATHPELFDLKRVPSQSAGCQDLYQRFLNAPLPRYFAAGANGRGCGYSFGAGASALKALDFCKGFSTQCVVHAHNLLLGPEPQQALPVVPVTVPMPLSDSAVSSPKSLTPAPP
jgi:pimeloyl-ACP methyl ester carboxylesterase